MSRSLVPFWALALAVFLCAYPFSFMLPTWAAWENGPIENLQVIVYLVGFMQAGYLAYRSEGKWRGFWIAASPVWLTLAARELSWGAVFYEPARLDEHGPVFTASKALWYGPAINPAIAVIFLVAAAFAIKAKAWTLLPAIWAKRQLPLIECLMAGVSVLLMTASERHMGMSLDAIIGESQIFEETIELAAGLFLLAAQQRVRLSRDT